MLIIFHHLILIIARTIFLTLGKGPNFGLNGGFGSSDKDISINFTKAYTKFSVSLHYNADNSYLFVNGKEIKNPTLKPTLKMLTFGRQFL